MEQKAIFTSFLKDRFNIDKERLDYDEIVNTIQKGVYFRGTNLWVLIFAIFIASLGLNMNSTAVIIGAMLVSPLMGPIMGIGLGVGINNFKLIRLSFTNFLVAVVISLIVSAIYFLLTPLNEAHSELLARTTPTFFDVLIALFGGLAGIVATSSREKGNVIPGVAIATALMPPLCTAGYGLATGNLFYFIGALYLFFINSVFIGFATFLMVRFLRFPFHHYPDPVTAKKVRIWIIAIVLLTFLPSVYIGYKMVNRNLFEKNSNKFISREMTFPDNTIIQKNIDPEKRAISLTYIGQEINQRMLDNARSKLPDYHLKNVTIQVNQGFGQRSASDISNIKTQIVQELFKNDEEHIKIQEQRIADLNNELTKYVTPQLSEAVFKEAKALNPMISELSVTRSFLVSDKNEQDTIYLAYIRFKRLPGALEQKRLENWLKTRLNAKEVKLFVAR